MRPHEWRPLTRRDLRGFDDGACDLILKAIGYGAVGRISQKGHALLRGPDGQTMSVSRNTGMGNRGRQNAEADFVRIFGAYEQEEKQAVGQNLTLVRKEQTVANTHPLVPPEEHPMLTCPAKDCEAEFVTEGARYTHIQKQHFPCREPGCDRVFTKKSAEQGHFNLSHGVVKRNRATVVKCPEPGCDYEGTPGGLGGHTNQVHRKGQAPKGRKSQAKAPTTNRVPQKSASSDSAPTVQVKAPDAETLLARVREALGVDPRVAELEAQLSEARRRADDLEAKLALLKEALEA